MQSSASEHEGDSGVESTYSSSGETFLYIRIAVPELNLQRCLQFNPEDTVWVAKQLILATLAKDLKNGLNYGVFCPPVNGRAGKFLDEERLLKDYSLPGPIGYLEFKYKRRVYKQLTLNPRKLKQINSKSNFKQFVEAVRRSDVQKIVKLTEKGLDPNFQDSENGETPLTLATSLLRPRSVIMALVDGGAMFDFRTRNGMTPVHKAARLGNAEGISTLLDLGAGVNYRDERGLTPLYHAVCHSTNATCANLLLYNYAIIGVTDSTGWTELHQACKFGRVQHVEQLLFYGAEMSQQNSGGNTPLHVCAINNQEECARVLLFRGADRMIKNYANQTAAEVAIIANNEQLSALISDFSSSDVVPIQEAPTYNTKRRAHPLISGSSFSNLQRCRSNPQLQSRNSVTSLGPIPNVGGTLGRSRGQLVECCSFDVDQVFDDLRSPQMFLRHRRSNGDQLGYDSDSLRSTSVSSIGSVSGSTGGEADMHGCLRQVQACNGITHNRRAVCLQKGGRGFGFILRGAKCHSSSKSRGGFMLDFNPTPQCPGLQYIEHVDPRSVAAAAGLLAGDFITEINGVSIACASHEYAVQLICDAVDQLVLTAVTVTDSSSGTAERSQTRVNVALNGHALPCVPSNDSIADDEVAKQRSARRQSVVSEQRATRHGKSTSKVGVDGKLTRFSSVPSLSFPCSSKSNLRTGPHFSSRPSIVISEEPSSSPPEMVYAIPSRERDQCDTESVRQPPPPPPPLPPPPEFRLRCGVSGELIPIATKVPHTYANVSQWISESSNEIESSFRPGMSAQLSQADDDDDARLVSIVRRRPSTDQDDREHSSDFDCAEQLDNALQHQPKDDPASSWSRAKTPLVDYRTTSPVTNCRTSGGDLCGRDDVVEADVGHVTNLVGDNEQGQGRSNVDEGIELPPPPPPPPLPPPPPPPPISAEHLAVFNVLQAAPPVPVPQPPPCAGATDRSAGLPPAGPSLSQRKAAVPEDKSSRVHADAIRQAVLMRREFVDASDMRNVAATIEQRILRARPLQRMVYKADRTKQAFQPPDSQPVPPSHLASKPVQPAGQPDSQLGLPCQLVGRALPPGHLLLRPPVPPSQPAVVSRRMTICDTPQVVEFSGQVQGRVSGSVPQSSDFLAMAEHARQEYVKRRVSSVGEVSSAVAGPVNGKSESLGSFAQMIAEKAMQRRRHTIVGDCADGGLNSDVPISPPCESIAAGSRERHTEERVGGSYCSTEQDSAHRNGGLRRSPCYNQCDNNDFSSSLSLVNESSRTRNTSTSYSDLNNDAHTIYLSDASSTPDYMSLIVPPPPPEFCSGSVEFASSTESSFSRDFTMMTPSPPPGFDDNGPSFIGDVLLRPVSSWTVDQVAAWLDSLQMGEHRDRFVECGIDGAQLTKLGRAELIQLGVTQVGQRMNLERAIKRTLMAKR